MRIGLSIKYVYTVCLCVGNIPRTYNTILIYGLYYMGDKNVFNALIIFV